MTDPGREKSKLLEDIRRQVELLLATDELSESQKAEILRQALKVIADGNRQE